MKHFPRLLLVSMVLASAAAFAAPFEGKVNFKMTSGAGQPQEMIYNIKGGKIRLEMPGQKSVGMILDPANKETIMIMEEQKMYMTMAIPDAAPSAEGDKASDVKLEKTGETEKILGHTATKYISTHEGTTTELWLAEGLGMFAAFNNANPMGGRGQRGGQASTDWARLLAGKELFPLRVVGKDKSGKESFRMETTAINEQSLPDSMFAPPPGYQKMDMGGMMKGIMPKMRR